MDARLEAAILDVLDRAGDGRAIDDAWLRATYPDHWREIRAFLAFEASVADGSPDGAKVGPYRLLRRLGRGGAGTVYLGRLDADHRGLPAGTPVAIKVIHAHLAERPEFVERVLAEARSAATHDHPNVIRTLDAGVEPGEEGDSATVFVVTEYVEGQNLRGLLDELGPLGEPLVRHLAAEILRALAAIHASGAAHGDLKPENVLIAPGDAIKVADVGAATPSVDAAESAARPFRGTLLYAAPERLGASGAPVDGRADLFSLGVMVDEFLAGSHPYSRPAGSPSRSPDRRARRPSAFLRAFSATLRADRPEDRFATAGEALAVLAAGENSPWWRERVAAAPRDELTAAWSHEPVRAASMHGREREADQLAAAFDDAASSGTGRTFVVAGDAGVGKTRLVSGAAAAARGRGALVVWCAYGDGAATSEPLAFALRTALAQAGVDPARHVAAAEGVERALAGWLAGTAAADGTPGLAASGRGAAVACLLRSLAAERPLLLVAEDLHAADDADVALVAHLAEELAASPALVVATTRTARADVVRRAMPRAAAIELSNLAVEAVCSLLAEVLGSDDLGDRLGPEAWRRTDGNPLAVLEMIDALRDADVLVQDAAGAWSLRDGGGGLGDSMSARAILAHRLAALPRADRDLLDVAACAGVRFDPTLVARALGRDPGRVLLRLARLERREHLVRASGDDVAFEHHEVRDAVLDALPADRARAHHASIAAAIEAFAAAHGGPSSVEAAALVRHSLQGGDGPRAAPHVVDVLERMLVAGRVTEAIQLATEALGQDGATPGSARTLVLLIRGRGLALLSRIAEAMADFETAGRHAAACGDDHGSREARTLVAECLEMRGRNDEALAMLHAIRAECVAAGDRQVLAMTHEAVGNVFGHQGRFREAVAEMRDLVELRRGSGPALEGEALYFLATTLADAGEKEESMTAATAALALLRSSGASAQLVVYTLALQSTSYADSGRREEAVALADEAARIARSIGDARMEATCRSYQADHLRVLGRFDGIEPLHRRALELCARIGRPSHEGQCLHHYGLYLSVVGRAAEALEQLERGRDLAIRAKTIPSHIRALNALATVHVKLGDRERALACSVAADELARATGSERISAVATWIHGRCGGPRGAPDLAALDEAVRQMRAQHIAEGTATALLDVAKVHAAAGRRDEALAAVTEARATLEARAARNGMIDCDAILVSLGAADPHEVAARLAAWWTQLDVFIRINAAAAVARAGGLPELLDRARSDVEFVVAHAVPDRAAGVRAHLEGVLSGAAGASAGR